jgi:type IV secretion system protein VirB4
MLRTRYNTVQYFNFHAGQLGHTLLIGPSRNGKTVFQMFLEAQFLKYPNARIFNLDKDLSCKPTTLLLDGKHIDLDPARGGGLRLNPIALTHTEHGRAWLVGWLDRLLSSRSRPLTDEEIEEVYGALTRLVGDSMARMSTLQTQLPDSLRLRLAPWCEGGAYGMYFDHVEDDFALAQVTTTEVGSLINAGLHDVVRAYADYAFYRIEQFLSDRTEAELGPTLIYFEEAGFLLEDPIFAAKARDYLMTLAKKRAFLVMTAQSPEPFINQPALGAAVRDNIATIIFLPNQNAARAELGRKYREAFGVNDTQLSLIASATPKAEYCIYQPQTGLFRVAVAQFPPEIVACIRSDAKSQGVLERFYDLEDPQWKEKYLTAVVNV